MPIKKHLIKQILDLKKSFTIYYKEQIKKNSFYYNEELQILRKYLTGERKADNENIGLLIKNI